MSLYGVQNVLFHLKKDKAFVAAFKADPQAALSKHELSDTDRDAVIGGDLVALYLMGVHPLLMAPYSRTMGIPRPRYQELLAPLKGARQMHS